MTTTAQPATEQEWRQRALGGGQRREVGPTDVRAQRRAGERPRLATLHRFDGNLVRPGRARLTAVAGVIHRPAWSVGDLPARVLRAARPAREPIEEPEDQPRAHPARAGQPRCTPPSTPSSPPCSTTRQRGPPGGPTSTATTSQTIGGQCADDAEARGARPVSPRSGTRARTASSPTSTRPSSTTTRCARRAGAGRCRRARASASTARRPVRDRAADGRTVRFPAASTGSTRGRDGLARRRLQDRQARSYTEHQRGRPDRAAAPSCSSRSTATRRAQRSRRHRHARCAAEYWFVADRAANSRTIGYAVTPRVETAYAEALAAIVDGIERRRVPRRTPERPAGCSSCVECRILRPRRPRHDRRWPRWERKRARPGLDGYVALAEPDALEATDGRPTWPTP